MTTLVPSTMWSDMGKIANLIEHFQEHKKEDGSISFWSFIELHYGSDFKKHQTEELKIYLIFLACKLNFK